MYIFYKIIILVMKEGEAGHDINLKASIAMPLLQRNP